MSILLFFHNSVRRRNRNNAIVGLKDENGVWKERGTDLNSLVLSYFNNIFSPVGGNQDYVLNCIAPKVSDIDNTMLTRRVLLQEVKDALFEMKPDKSPSPDGLKPGFFIHFWDLLSPELLRFCSDCISFGNIPSEINSTHIVLIPKKGKPEVMGDLRPIVLCNTIYKIMSKVLANRLKPLLNNMVSESQSAFVPGRLITDNIMIAFEINHYLKRKVQGKIGFAGIKLDMSKAYDRVSWAFLGGILSRLGFSNHIVNLIWNMISTVKYRFLLEGQEIGVVSPGRGLRQGDPLSPYLFILVMDVFHTLIQDRASRGQINGVSIARGLQKSQIFSLLMTAIFFAKQLSRSVLLSKLLYNLFLIPLVRRSIFQNHQSLSVRTSVWKAERQCVVS